MAPKRAHCKKIHSTLVETGYSRVPNTRRVWNNCIGWKISPKSIVVGGGINVLGGKFAQN